MMRWKLKILLNHTVSDITYLRDIHHEFSLFFFPFSLPYFNTFIPSTTFNLVFRRSNEKHQKMIFGWKRSNIYRRSYVHTVITTATDNHHHHRMVRITIVDTWHLGTRSLGTESDYCTVDTYVTVEPGLGSSHLHSPRESKQDPNRKAWYCTSLPSPTKVSFVIRCLKGVEFYKKDVDDRSQ